MRNVGRRAAAGSLGSIDLDNIVAGAGYHKRSSSIVSPAASAILKTIVKSVSGKDTYSEDDDLGERRRYIVLLAVLIFFLLAIAGVLGLFVWLYFLFFGPQTSLCSSFTANPCGFGTCVSNLKNNDYICICPPGFSLGNFSIDESATCVAASQSKNPDYFTVPNGFSIGISVICHNFRVSVSTFLSRNIEVDFSEKLPEGTIVKIGDPDFAHCSIPYLVHKSDTCSSVEHKFSLNSSSLHQLNPNVNCHRLKPGKQICVKRGSLPEVPLPTAVVPIDKNGHCDSLVKEHFGGNWTEFYSLNPGVNCDRLPVQSHWWNAATGVALRSVSIKATTTTSTTYIANCKKKAGILFPPPSKSTCSQLIAKYYGNKTTLFVTYNNGFLCTAAVLTQLGTGCLCGVTVPLTMRCAVVP